MKYGLLINKRNQNLGDDIQSYAESLFLPRVDVMIHRENLDVFKYDDMTEPVAVIMGAWFMQRKFNWPPARQIIPLLVGYHHFERDKDWKKAKKYYAPIFRRHYNGIGGQWFKDYGPVGCRDNYTCKVFSRKGIPNYFSGCVTLTLPKQPRTADNGKYAVVVDVSKEVETSVRKRAPRSLEIRKTTHTVERIPDATWEERKKRVEKQLILYQNARYVITTRLHVALPCLAMGVPVVLIEAKDANDPKRFDPYTKWLKYVSEKDFTNRKYKDFDFKNGTPNPEKHIETRTNLIKTIEEFVLYCQENEDKPLDFFDRLTYTDEDCMAWKVRYLRLIMKLTYLESRRMFIEYSRATGKEIDIPDIDEEEEDGQEQ